MATGMPVLLLIFLYFRQRSVAPHSKFVRNIVSSPALLSKYSIALEPYGPADNIITGRNDIWLNQRYGLLRLTKHLDSAKEVPLVRIGSNQSVTNFYIDSDKITYRLSNDTIVNVITDRSTTISHFRFGFPATYFVKLSDSSFLFQETVVGRVFDRVHFKDYRLKEDKIDSTAFSRDTGSSMIYSGNWVKSSGNDNIFIPEFDDTIFDLDSAGRLKWKFKAIDAQYQNLKIIREGDRYYLNPNVLLLRYGGCILGNKLYVSSYVRAENQDIESIRTNIDVDVYNLRDGSYKNSFYIPNYHRESVIDFKISSDSVLYAVYKDEVVGYDMVKFLRELK